MMIETELKFLDISKLLSGELPEIPFETEFSSPAEGVDGIGIDHLRFFGQAYDQSGFPRLSGTVQAELFAPCARCLAPVREVLEVTLDLGIIPEGETSEEEEIVFAQGQKIDLGELAEEALFTNLPLRLLCKEDCKGLCPQCGKDLNEGACACEQKEIDPRLAGLADFFK